MIRFPCLALLASFALLGCGSQRCVISPSKEVPSEKIASACEAGQDCGLEEDGEGLLEENEPLVSMTCKEADPCDALQVLTEVAKVSPVACEHQKYPKIDLSAQAVPGRRIEEEILKVIGVQMALPLEEGDVVLVEKKPKLQSPSLEQHLKLLRDWSPNIRVQPEAVRRFSGGELCQVYVGRSALFGQGRRALSRKDLCSGLSGLTTYLFSDGRYADFSWGCLWREVVDIGSWRADSGAISTESAGLMTEWAEGSRSFLIPYQLKKSRIPFTLWISSESVEALVNAKDSSPQAEQALINSSWVLLQPFQSEAASQSRKEHLYASMFEAQLREERELRRQGEVLRVHKSISFPER